MCVLVRVIVSAFAPSQVQVLLLHLFMSQSNSTHDSSDTKEPSLDVEAAFSPTLSSSPSESSLAQTGHMRKKSFLNANSPAFVPGSSPVFSAAVALSQLPPLTESTQYSVPHVYDPAIAQYAPSSFLNSTESFPQNVDPASVSKGVMDQVEFYLSDANLWKDKFLRAEVAKSPEGWVEIALMAGFKRMQKLTTDLDLVVSTLRQSSKLAVSEDGKFIRRLNPLPPRDERNENKKILRVSSLPLEICVIDLLTQIFSAYGKVALVDLDVGRHSAHINFDSPASVNKASKDAALVEKYPGLVVERKIDYLKKLKEQTKEKSKEPNSQQDHEKDAASEKPKKKEKIPLRDFNNWRLDFKPGESASPDRGPGAHKPLIIDGIRKTPQKDHGDHLHSPSPGGSPGISPRVNASEHKPKFIHKKEVLPLNPTGKPPKFATLTKKIVVKVRMAKGPDSTIGFGAGRGRPIPSPGF